MRLLCVPVLTGSYGNKVVKIMATWRSSQPIRAMACFAGSEAEAWEP